MPYQININQQRKNQPGNIQAPMANFFIIFVMTFALFFSAGFYVLWKNANSLNNLWNQSTEISLYLKKNVSAKTAADLTKKLESDDSIAAVKLIAPADGIKNFAIAAGFDEILLGFKENPLPYLIIIYPKINQLTADQIFSLIDNFKKIPEVETTKANIDWIKKVKHLLKLWKNLFIILFLLNLSALIVVCCTAYVTPQIIMNSDSSRRTLQYQGFWQVLISSLLAISLTNLTLIIFQHSGFILLGLDLIDAIAFILLSILLSTTSAQFALKNIHFDNQT
jgi:cell division transport system permease protein